jgi:hypothetical protein
MCFSWPWAWNTASSDIYRRKDTKKGSGKKPDPSLFSCIPFASYRFIVMFPETSIRVSRMADIMLAGAVINKGHKPIKSF